MSPDEKRTCTTLLLRRQAPSFYARNKCTIAGEREMHSFCKMLQTFKRNWKEDVNFQYGYSPELIGNIWHSRES